MFLMKTWISQNCEERVTPGLEVVQHRKQLELDWAASENGARPSGLLQLPPLSCFPPGEGVACGTHVYDWFCDTGVSSLPRLHADVPTNTIAPPPRVQDSSSSGWVSATPSCFGRESYVCHSTCPLCYIANFKDMTTRTSMCMCVCPTCEGRGMSPYRYICISI